MAEEKPKIYRKGIFIPYMGELVLDGYLYKMPFQVDTSKWRTIDTFEEFFDLITDDFILHSHEAEVRRKEKDKFPLKILVKREYEATITLLFELLINLHFDN